MAFIRTVLIIGAMLLVWTALRSPGMAGSGVSAPATTVATTPAAMTQAAPTQPVTPGAR